MTNTAEHRGLPDEGFDLVQAQYEASSTIYGSNDPAEILEAFVNFVGTGFTSGHLALVESDPTMVRIIAEADTHGVRATRQYQRLDEYPAYDTLPAIEVLTVEDISSDIFLTDSERERLASQNIRSMMIAPLVVGQRLIGILAFWQAESATLPAGHIRALRSLADQAAVVFENQALLRSTETSLEEVRALYEINRAMLGAQDTLDVLRLLRLHLATDATSIVHVLVEHGVDRTQRGVLRHMLTAEEERIVNLPLNLFGTVDETGSSNVVVVEDTSVETTNPLNPVLREQGAASYVLLIVRERGQIEDLIAITFDEPRIPDTRTFRLYVAVTDQITIVLQNQRLLRDTQANAIQLSRQVRVLQAVNRLATGAGSFRDETSLFDYIIEVMTTSLNADHGGAMIFDPALEYGTVVSEYPSHGTVGIRLEMRGNALFEALLEDVSQPFIVPDVEIDPRVTPETREVFRSTGIKSLMMVPITLEGKLIASIGLDLFTRERQFTLEMVELAQTMGAQLAVSLQNIRLLNDAQRRADQLQRIATFSQAVQVTLEKQALLNTMLSESHQMIALDRMSLALFDPVRQELRIVAQYEDEKIDIDLESGAVLPLSGTLVGDAWEKQQPIYIDNVDDSQQLRRGQLTTMRSLVIAPIRSRGQTLGTIQIGSYRPYAYSETDIALLQQMITQFTVALENAEAYAQSQRAAKNQALVNDITAHLQRSSDVQRMMEVTLEELSRALGARRARARLTVQADGNGSEAE
jgi:GAF domain-containing protein